MRIQTRGSLGIVPLIVALALPALAPVPAAAQGGLFKKAKDKLLTKPAEQAVGAPQGNGPAPTFTDQLLEATPERIDAYLRGIARGKQFKSPSGLTVAELNARADKALSKYNEIMNDKDSERQVHEAATLKYDAAFEDALSAIKKEQEQAMAARLGGGTNMAEMKKLATMSAKMQTMYAEGDTAGALKAQAAYLKYMGVDPAADTLKARAKCGPPPPQPGWLKEALSLRDLANMSLDQARKDEGTKNGMQLEGSDMTQMQFGLLQERIMAFVNSDGKPDNRWRFSGDERSALSSRMSDIRSALAAK